MQLTIFVALSWWIIRASGGGRRFKILYGAWATLKTVYLSTMLTFLIGAAGSFVPHQIVTFANMEQFGKNVITVLLDSDDKGYALLLLRATTQSRESSPSKLIFYLPRTEVKQFTVLQEKPLYDIIRDYDSKAVPPTGQTNPGAESGTPIK